MKKQKRRPQYHAPISRRQKREDAIKRELAIALYTHGKPLTMDQLACRMKVSRGGWLMDILNAMADRGDLVPTTYIYKGGVCKTRTTFALPPTKQAAAAARVWQ